MAGIRSNLMGGLQPSNLEFSLDGFPLNCFSGAASDSRRWKGVWEGALASRSSPSRLRGGLGTQSDSPSAGPAPLETHLDLEAVSLALPQSQGRSGGSGSASPTPLPPRSNLEPALGRLPPSSPETPACRGHTRSPWGPLAPHPRGSLPSLSPPGFPSLQTLCLPPSFPPSFSPCLEWP